MAPGYPEKSPNPGSIVLSPETFKGNVTDIATSLRGEGFRNIFFMVDHGSDQKPTVEAIDAFNQKWKGDGATAYYIKEFYNYNELEKYESDTLGVHEKTDGFHDDYYTASISLAIDPETLRMPERVKAKKTMLNGQDMNSPKALEDGKKMMQYRLDSAVRGIQRVLAQK
jgi:creatinine amidohydrolase/Fe(II)-dependent formamide hydrolase-like protein